MGNLKPAYRIDRDYYYNYDQGPFFEGEFVESLPKSPVEIFGGIIDYPIGVPAGLLLNGRWVELYAKLGFCLLVYKTVRSRPHPCHPFPNCLFVKADMFDPERIPEVITVSDSPYPDEKRVTITNSFGMPSASPEEWQEDMERTKARLPEGAMLVGSGVGTYEGTSWELVRDFVRVASMLREVGVAAIELNFSCPNVGKGEGAIYRDPEFSAEILAAVRKAVRDVPLVVKIGLLLGRELEEFVSKCAFFLEGISGLNSIQMRVVDEFGRPALGEGRERSGVCGWALGRCSEVFVRQLAELRERLKADFSILACGGVVDRESFLRLKEAGADVVMSCTGAMFNPYLAKEVRSLG